MIEKIKQSFSHWTKLDYAWLVIANLIILSLSLYWKDSLIAIISAMTGITCVIFVSKQMISNYYFGIINSALYALIAFDARLYGDAMLNAFFYLPTQFIGLYLWNKASKDNDGDGDVQVKTLTSKQRIFVAIACVVSIFAYGFVLKLIGGDIPFIDATTTVLSVIAQILIIKAYMEQWYLWIFVNIASVGMWALSLSQGIGDVATLVMWILFLANSLFGLYQWRKAVKSQKNHLTSFIDK